MPPALPCIEQLLTYACNMPTLSAQRVRTSVRLLLSLFLVVCIFVFSQGRQNHSDKQTPVLATLNACLNAASAACILAGYAFISRSKRVAHRVCMTLALGLSIAFLVSYVAYHASVGHVSYMGHGFAKGVYFAVLIPHVLLAAASLPFIILTALRAMRGQFDRHVKLARFTLPLWLYVSLSGVLVYIQLYGY